MSYITLQDLAARFGWDELNGLTEAGVDLTQAIADANALTDSYVGAVHALPLLEVPAALKGPVCDIARFYAYKDSPSETIRQRYEDAIEFLRAVATREVTLNVPPPEEEEFPEGAWFDASRRFFTRRTLRGL